MTIIDCPAWCREHHDPREEINHYGSTDHAAALVHDEGGAFVALHRLDRDGAPGSVEVLVGAVVLNSEQAKRLARYALASGAPV